MFKGSLIKLIIGALILVFSYALPIFMIPLGSYSHTENSVTTSFEFKWNGKVEKTIAYEGSSVSTNNYYEIDDKAIYYGESKDIDKNEFTKLAEIKNIYTIESGDAEFKNYWALGFTIIGFVLTAWGVLGFVVSKKK